MTAATVDKAFPRLDPAELALVAKLGREQQLADGETAFVAGDADIDFCVVLEGALDVVNPSDHDKRVATHGPGEFAGDIDLLTRRPVIVTARACGATKVVRVPGGQLRRLLNVVPRLGEKLIDAFTIRRDLLAGAGVLGIRVMGGAYCAETTRLREFLHKNFVPFTWIDTDTDAGNDECRDVPGATAFPSVECQDKTVLVRPSLRELAGCAGVWRSCPDQTVDLCVVGAGPAGIAAAVYAASEGLRTIVLDRLGPGGQVAGSSRIENFIGFPSGLTGTELATRGVLQMLKFGAGLYAPVDVTGLRLADEPGGLHELELDCGTTVRAGVVLIATGVRWRRLEAQGARRFERAGVYYSCTTVEAYAHDEQDVVVIGPGNSAGQAAMFMAECCRSRTVHMLLRGPEIGPGMSEYLCKRILGTPNIKVRTGVEVDAVLGADRVEGVRLRAARRDEEGPNEASDPKAGAERIDATAVYVFIGAEPHSEWLPAAIERDRKGYVLTGDAAARTGKWPMDEPPSPLETTVPGILAAGDLRAGSTKRVGFAVGDGSLAVTCVHALRARAVTGSRRTTL